MKRYLLTTVLAGATLAVGCGGAYVSSYSANTPPPPLQAEVYGDAPGPGFVWVQGHWVSQGGRYRWVTGRWDRPPRGHSRWEAGRWEKRGEEYRFREGDWR